MRLLIDMNLTPRWVHFLRHAGYEAVHWSSVGPNSAK
jgi:predicted nuclease of predicted toxin-antitoxin system